MSSVKSIREEVKLYIEKADASTIKKLHAIIEAEDDNNWWDDLPTAVKKSILKAEKQLEEGKGIPHEVVMKKYKRWLTK